jgi:hypothetical protein
MYFAPIDTRLPIELLCIRMAAYVETPAEKHNLLLAWRQALMNGPSTPRRPLPKTTSAGGGTFTKDSAGVSPRRIEQLQRCLEVA